MDDLEPRDIRVDQLLHGYRQGHRLIAGSLEVSETDASVVRALSDALTSDVGDGRTSYLSGYPLRTATKYVLSRTWAAPESHRPGSVWTHSLIVDYSALTILEDLSLLLAFFRRPDGTDLSGYNLPNAISARDQSRQSNSAAFSAPPRAHDALVRLYGSQAEARISLPASREVTDDERLAIMLWRQMWPGLRRDFAFFTRASGEITEVRPGTMLVFSSDRAPLTVSRAHQAAAQDYSEAYAALLADLPLPGPTELRRFLARYAFDAKEPRRVVPELLMLRVHAADPGRLASVLTRQASGTDQFPRLKKDLLIGAATRSGDFEGLVATLGAFRQEPIDAAPAEIARIISSLPLDTGQLARLFTAALPSEAGQLGDAIIGAVLRSKPIETLLKVDAGLGWRARLMALRPTVLKNPKFWDLNRTERRRLLSDALAANEPTSILLNGLRTGLSADELRDILSARPQDDLIVFEALHQTGLDAERRSVLAGLAFRPSFIGRLASSEAAVSLEELETISAGMIHPEADKPDLRLWTRLWHRLGEPFPGAEYPHINAVLFGTAPSLDWSLRAPIVMQTFDAVYEGVTSYRLPENARRFVDRSVSEISRAWSLQDRMLSAVVQMFGGASRPRPELLFVSQRPEYFLDLLRRLADDGGKKALEKLLRAAEKPRAPEYKDRADALRSFMRKRDAPWWALG